MKSLKAGYNEEFRCVCLAMVLAIALPSPYLIELLGMCLPIGDSAFGKVIGYACFLALAYCMGITLDGLIPYKVKDWLIYPSVKGHGLKRPGCTVFSKINGSKANDLRFNLDDAKQRYSSRIQKLGDLDLAASARFQNSEWYKIYRRYSERKSVSYNHLGFLYGRDVFTLSVLALACCALSNIVCLISNVQPAISITSFLIIGFLAAASWITSHNKGKRFVYSVIACDLALGEEKE